MSNRHRPNKRRTDKYSPERPADGFVLPEPPKVADMQRTEPFGEIYTVLNAHFKERPDILVGARGYLCHDASNPDDWLVLDIVIAFGVYPSAIMGRNGYMISEVGKPPDCVIEVAAAEFLLGEPVDKSGWGDFANNRDGFAAYGVGEYWRFDYKAGENYDQPLAGDVLVDGEYQPIPLDHRPDGKIHGRSPALGLDLSWEDGRLRFIKRKRPGYLPNFEETGRQLKAEKIRAASESARRITAENRVAALQAELHQLRGEQQGSTSQNGHIWSSRARS